MVISLTNHTFPVVFTVAIVLESVICSGSNDLVSFSVLLDLSVRTKTGK